MRSNLRILVAVAAALLVAPVAMAENVEEQLTLMNERMEQLENQLGATQDELDASMDKVERQKGVMEKAGLERQGQSGLSAFYQNVEISGHIAASWFWNFNDPGDALIEGQNRWPADALGGGSANGGFGGAFYPLHPDHNSFNLDQLWFTMHKPATEESRAGFNADIVFGRTAGILNGGEAFKCASNSDCASEINLVTAYIEYLTPWGPTIKAGKIPTWLGYEVANTTQNFNITRGNVWSLFQPINHVGVALEGDVGGFTYGIAAVNNSGWDNPDYNNDKHLMAKVGYGTEMFSGQIAFLYGQESTNWGESEPIGTVDLLLTADPTENFSAWFNFDYKFSDSGAPEAWGVALAGRYAFTEKLGYALRGEFVQSNGGSTGIAGDELDTVLPRGLTIGNGRDADIYGVTGTLDYLITDGLTLKWELRYDYIDSNDSCGDFSNTQSNNTFAAFGCSNQFVKNESDEDAGGINARFQYTRRSQVSTGLELVYQF